MRTASPSVEALIRKVCKAIKTEDAPLRLLGAWGVTHWSPYKLEDAAGNHAFDDHPEAFGITENEGHRIRAFFQESNGTRNDEEFKAYIQNLINTCEELNE